MSDDPTTVPEPEPVVDPGFDPTDSAQGTAAFFEAMRNGDPSLLHGPGIVPAPDDGPGS